MAGRAARAACVSSPCGRGRGHEAASAGGEDPVGGGLDVFVVSGMFGVDQVDWYSMGPQMTMGNLSHGTISMVFQGSSQLKEFLINPHMFGLFSFFLLVSFFLSGLFGVFLLVFLE